jgi:hypothetical protein
MRERVLKEILETEKEYVKRLVAIMKGYLEPMTVAHPKCGKALEEEKTFSCVNEIYMFHKLLMEDLSVRLAPPDSDETKPSNIGSKLIGDIFNRMVRSSSSSSA